MNIALHPTLHVDPRRVAALAAAALLLLLGLVLGLRVASSQTPHGSTEAPLATPHALF
jgi:hypothetical protein